MEIDANLSIIDSCNELDVPEEIDGDVNADVHGQLRKKKKYAKPNRYCIFCNKMSRKLTRHITLVHKNIPRVKLALRMKKRDRIRQFQIFKREGINTYNRNEAKKSSPCYQGERKRNKYMELLHCRNCDSFISKRFFSRHARNCCDTTDSCTVEGVPMEAFSLPKDTKVSEDFVHSILSKLRGKDIPDVIFKDKLILHVGNKLYKKLSFKKEKVATARTQVRSEMRMLASCLEFTRNLDGFVKTHDNVLDLFNRDNFDHLCDCIDAMTTGENNEMKSGQRKNLYYMLRRVGKELRDKLYQDKEEVLSSEVNSFLRTLKSNKSHLLLNALYNLEQSKLKKARKPCQLPIEEDIVCIYDYIKKKMNALCDDFNYWTSSNFIELRNVTMTRLTLLNARRGGEVGRLQLVDWDEAKKDGWIDSQRLEQLTEADKLLVKSVKMAYMTGKGNHHIVPLIIPNDTIISLDKLADKETRKVSGVSAKNPFLFASTQHSDINFSGWHALKEVCKKVTLKRADLVNATNNRHRVSTVYAAMDVPENERRFFYSHMGHSESMNKDTYQAPLAIMGITKVGKELLEMEKGKKIYNLN